MRDEREGREPDAAEPDREPATPPGEPVENSPGAPRKDELEAHPEGEPPPS